ncbi:MAG: zinc-ribbon domain-containing protein [Chloroflexi bacterium]|nr:zinc-ribbon domain-containing protein [Chloroflexota bacterium]
MLLLFGSRYNTEFLGPIQVPCPSCGNAPCGLHASRQKFTFFFVPTFTMSTRYIMKCGHCKFQWEVNKATAQQFQLNPNGPYGDARPGAAGPANPRGFAQGPAAATMNYPGRPPSGGPSPTASDRIVCPACGAATMPGAFCGACGAKLPPQR